MGYEAGRARGSWVEINSPEEAKRILRGIEDGDPELMDLEPSALSGEWASESIPELSAEFDLDLSDDDVAAEFEQGYSDGFWSEVQGTATSVAGPEVARRIREGNPLFRGRARGISQPAARRRYRRSFPRRGMGAAGKRIRLGNPGPEDLEGAPEHLPLYERLTQTVHWMMHEAEVLKRAAADAEDADMSASTVGAAEEAAEELTNAAEVLEKAADAAEEAAEEAAEDVADTIEDLTAAAVEETTDAAEELEAASEIVAGNPASMTGRPEDGSQPIPSSPPGAVPVGESESSPPVPPDIAPEAQHWYKRRWKVSDDG